MSSDALPRPVGHAGLRGRRGIRAAWALTLVACVLGAGASASSRQSQLKIEITSPLGRTGMTGPVRIVARITGVSSGTSLSPVQFFVDAKKVGEDNDGPPYAVEWVDGNPFEKREIVAQVADERGQSARAVIELKPLEIEEKASVSSVLLEPGVLDANGRPVNGLNVDDFEVREDDVLQKVELAAPDTIPAQYTLLVDSSQSMSRRMGFVRDAAAQLPRRLRRDDQVVVVPFSMKLGAITGPTKDRQTIADAIDGISASGGTAILDCITAAARQLNDNETRNIIVLITDGYDEDSKLAFDQALKAIKETKATVYVIGVGGIAGISLKGETLLRQLAIESGGKAFFPSREFQIADVHDVIASDVQERYMLSYTPINQKVDGTWRAVTVKTRTPTDVIRVRPGYYAPPPPPIRPKIELTIKDLNRTLIDVTPNDLLVLEDGVEQQVEGFEESLAPVSIMLVLDSSGSMKKDAAAVSAAARSFVRSLPAKDKLAVMTFADKPQLAHDLSTNRDWSLDAIGRYEALGGTALYDALFQSLSRLHRADGRTAIVVLTDGRDENNPGTAPGSVRNLEEVLLGIKDVGATIYAIGLGPTVDRVTLERIAEASGGESYFPADVSTLDAEYKRVLENLRRRYVISYTSTNNVHDGAWRKVEIRPKREDFTVDTAGGYFAPEDK